MNIYYENNTKEKTVLLTIPKATLAWLTEPIKDNIYGKCSFQRANGAVWLSAKNSEGSTVRCVRVCSIESWGFGDLAEFESCRAMMELRFGKDIEFRIHGAGSTESEISTYTNAVAADKDGVERPVQLQFVHKERIEPAWTLFRSRVTWASAGLGVDAENLRELVSGVHGPVTWGSATIPGDGERSDIQALIVSSEPGDMDQLEWFGLSVAKQLKLAV